MAEQNIKKLYRNRVGLEDLTTGVGTETQTRNGQAVTITKINASNLPFDESLTLQEVYDDISIKQETVNIDKEYIDNRLDLELDSGDTVQETLNTITTEPVKTQLSDAESNAEKAKLEAWNAEAERMTSDSYANEAEDVLVKLYTSNGDGTFSYTESTKYSSLHWKLKAEGFAEGDASNINYDNTTSDLAAEDVQEAIDEVESRLDTSETNISTNTTNIATNAANIATNAANIATNASNASTDIAELDSRLINQVASSTCINPDSIGITNTVNTTGFSTYLHTGNGTTQDIENGIDFITAGASVMSLPLWVAGTYNTGDEVTIVREGRVIRVVCLQDGVTSDPNTLYDFTDATFSDWQIDSQTNGGLAWVKSRSGVYSHHLQDTLRGALVFLSSDTTFANQNTGTWDISSFENNGFILAGSNVRSNADGVTYVSWSYQTTHIKSSLTSHGKPQIEEYNPITGFTIIKYKGSGLAGHEISHSMGRELGLAYIKNLQDGVYNWRVYRGRDGYSLYLNSTSQETINDTYGGIEYQTDSIINPDGNIVNASNQTIVIYGWANSTETDEGLQGNYEIGTYTGTGVAGNKITTRGKPAYVMIKRLDSTGNWSAMDIVRGLGSGTDAHLYLNTSDVEGAGSNFDTGENYFQIDGTLAQWNASGGQYLYFVVYDNDSGSGKSKYDKPTDTSNLNLTNSYFNYTAGLTDKGYTLTSRAVTKTVDTSDVSDGIKWVSENSDGSNSFYDDKPSLEWSEVGVAFNEDGKWYEDNVLITPTPSFIQNPVMIENGIPQYIDYSQELETNYMDSLVVEKLTTKNNRVVKEIGTIYNNNRYVILWTELFADYEGDYESYDAKVQVSETGEDGTWFNVGQSRDGGSSDYGVLEGALYEGVVVRTASDYLMSGSSSSLGMATKAPSGSLTSALARVIVTYHGKAKEI